MADRTVRIGGASGYWGDTAIGPRQLVAMDGLDYIVLDYLAEITMSILAKARAGNPEAGYATDFIGQVMRPLIRPILEKRIKVVANAGGLNLQACRRALQEVAAQAGLTLRVGTVEGDDLMPILGELRERGAAEMDTGAPLPPRVMSANAYLGAFPIAAALRAGADIVVTGRCVDSALVAGPLIHAFGWRPDDYDRLAAAGLAGHLLECGAQATGGNFTDWRETVDGWDDTGFPVAEVAADGGFVLTRPAGTGGAVTPLTAGEQMLYEIGDPSAYVLPDVVCDFTHVEMEEIGRDRVRISGARGRAPTDAYKVSATWADGHACIGAFVVAGRDAAEKGRRQGESVLRRAGRMLSEHGLPGFSKTSIDVVGTEALYGASANPALQAGREVVLRLAVHHESREGAELFSKEFVGAALSTAPGLTALSPGRPRPSPVVRLHSFLVDKDMVKVTVSVDGEPVPLSHVVARGEGTAERAAPAETAAAPEGQGGERVDIPLVRLAVARSGDKGDKANIGVIARRPEFLAPLRESLTADRVKRLFAHVAEGEVRRFDLPGIHAMNFLLDRALGGGGAASLNLDPQAKTYAQVLLDTPVSVRVEDARAWGLLPA